MGLSQAVEGEAETGVCSDARLMPSGLEAAVLSSAIEYEGTQLLTDVVRDIEPRPRPLVPHDRSELSSIIGADGRQLLTDPVLLGKEQLDLLRTG